MFHAFVGAGRVRGDGGDDDDDDDDDDIGDWESSIDSRKGSDAA
jgi:hypothetical protein